MIHLTDLEVPPGFLDQYLIRVRRHTRSLTYGGHLRRRMGQSQEFREFKTYSLGDDLRHLDFRNSELRQKRRPLPWENLLLRRFEAEEQMQIVISLDTRETMLFPRTEPRLTEKSLAISKLQIARWTAEAIARIAAKTRDIVVLHRLFGKQSAIIPLRGASIEAHISAALKEVIGTDPAPDQLSLDGLSLYLPPAAVWIIISDFYFPDHVETDTGGERGSALYRYLRDSEDGMCWIMLLDLDTWAAERELLGEGARRLEGPFSPRKEIHVTRKLLDETEERIREHKQPFTDWAAAYGAWEWLPRKQLGTLEQARAFFLNCFEQDKRIAELFRRDA